MACHTPGIEHESTPAVVKALSPKHRTESYFSLLLVWTWQSPICEALCSVLEVDQLGRHVVFWSLHSSVGETEAKQLVTQCDEYCGGEEELVWELILGTTLRWCCQGRFLVEGEFEWTLGKRVTGWWGLSRPMESWDGKGQNIVKEQRERQCGWYEDSGEPWEASMVRRGQGLALWWTLELDLKQGRVMIRFVCALRWLAVFWKMVWGVRGVAVRTPIMKFLEKKDDNNLT